MIWISKLGKAGWSLSIDFQRPDFPHRFPEAQLGENLRKPAKSVDERSPYVSRYASAARRLEADSEKLDAIALDRVKVPSAM